MLNFITNRVSVFSDGMIILIIFIKYLSPILEKKYQNKNDTRLSIVFFKTSKARFARALI